MKPHLQLKIRQAAPKFIPDVARRLATLILLGIAVHLLLPQITTFESALKIIERLPMLPIGLALLAQLGCYIGSGYVLRAIADLTGSNLPLWRGSMISLGATSIGLIAGGPIGNAASSFRWMQGSGVSREGALLAGWLPSLLNSGILMIIASAGLIHLLVAHELSRLQAIAFVLILVTLLGIIGGLAWGIHHREHLGRALGALSHLWSRIRRRSYDPTGTEEELERIFSTWEALQAGGWRGPVLGSAMYVTCDMLTLYLLFVAAGHAVHPGVLLTGYGLPLLLGKVSFLPGGIGIIEATMTAIYDGMGVPDAVTVLVILTYRAISFWVPSLIGFALLPALQTLAPLTDRSATAQ